jgi:RNA methyltransferase, TrmH family
MLTSLTNPKIKLARSLSRRREREQARQFVIEGVRLIEEAVGAGITPALAFYTSSAHGDRRARILLERIVKLTRESYEVSNTVMRDIASTETPPGILAVVPFPDLAITPRPTFVLILDGLRDPGNLGAILRSARASGVDLVLLGPGTVDAYNDKVVRAAMGAHFRIPIRSASWVEIGEKTRDMQRVYLADAHGSLIYSDADWLRPLALIIGGESEGATEPARQLATARVRIPMRGDTESLNVAMAATLLMFEANRAG